MATTYGYDRTIRDRDFDTVLGAVTSALAAEGFGILAEIDVQEALKKKLGVDFRRYKILGACNPPLAHKALGAEPLLGLLLPCNVVVAEAENGPGVTVAVIDARAMFSLIDNPELGQIAEDVNARLERALAAV